MVRDTCLDIGVGQNLTTTKLNFAFMHFTFYSIIQCGTIQITNDSTISLLICDAHMNYMGRQILQHKGQEGTSPTPE